MSSKTARCTPVYRDRRFITQPINTNNHIYESIDKKQTFKLNHDFDE